MIKHFVDGHVAAAVEIRRRRNLRVKQTQPTGAATAKGKVWC